MYFVMATVLLLMFFVTGLALIILSFLVGFSHALFLYSGVVIVVACAMIIVAILVSDFFARSKNRESSQSWPS